MTQARHDRILAIFEDWKRMDPVAFADKYHQIQISIEVGKNPAVGALSSIAEHALGHDGWTVVEVFAGDPILIMQPAD